MNYITKHKNCKEGHAWNEIKTTAVDAESSRRLKMVLEIVKAMTNTLKDNRPLITFNTDWNKDHKCGGELCIVCGYRKKIKKSNECRFGHHCTSVCGNSKDCPCQYDHCCALTETCEGIEHCDNHYEPNDECSACGETFKYHEQGGCAQI